MTDKTAADMLRELDAAATPGPWKDNGTNQVYTDEKAGKWLFEAPRSWGAVDEAANCHTIAALRNAAPALADALDDMRVTHSTCTFPESCGGCAALAAVTEALGGGA